MANMLELALIIKATDLASESLRGVGERLNEMGAFGKIAEVGLGAAALAIAGLGEGIKESVGAAAEYQTSFTKIAALTDSTASDLDAYRQAIEDVGATTGKSAVELSDAMFFIASAGLKGADAVQTLDAAAKASASGLGETKVVADAVTSTLNAYKLSGDQASHVTDILTEAVVQGKSAADQFAPALGRVLPIAAAAGVGFDEVAASMATMTRVGLNTDEAATALRGTLGALEKPGKQAQEALHSIGLSAGEVRQEIRDKGLLVTLQDMMDRTGGNIDVLGKIIPNIRALTGVLATAGSQGDAYKDILASMQTAEGKTDDAFQKTSQTFNFQMGLLKQRFEELAIDVGQQLLPGLTPFIAWLADEMPHATAIARQALGGDLLGALDKVGPAVGSVTDQIIDNLGQWTEAFLSWVAPMIPPLLGKLADLASQLLGWIVARLPQIVAQLEQWGLAFIGWLEPRIPPLIAQLEALGAQVMDWIVGTAAPAIAAQLVAWGQAFIDWIEPQIPVVVAKAGEILQALGAWIADTAVPVIVYNLVLWGKAFINWVAKDVIPNLPGALANIANAVVNWVTGGGLSTMLAQGAQLGQAIVQGLINGITAGIGNVAAAASHLVENAIAAARAAADAHSPSQAMQLLGQDMGEGLNLGLLEHIPKVKQTAKTYGDTILNEMETFTDQVDKASRSVGEKLDDIATKTGDSIAKTVDKANGEIAKTIDQTQKELDRLGGVFADPTSFDMREKAIRDEINVEKDAYKQRRQDEEQAYLHSKDLATADATYKKDLDVADLKFHQQMEDAKTDKDRQAITERHTDQLQSMRQRHDDEIATINQRYQDQIAETQRRRQIDAAERDFTKSEDAKLTAFKEQQLIIDRDQKIAAITEGEQKSTDAIVEAADDQRQKLLRSYQDKIADFTSQFVDKVPPLTGQAAETMQAFLDNINQATADTAQQIVDAMTKSATGIDTVTTATDNLDSALDAIPTNINVNINEAIHQSGGGGGGGGGGGSGGNPPPPPGLPPPSGGGGPGPVGPAGGEGGGIPKPGQPFDAGGILTEPVFGRGLYSGTSYGFALTGPEFFGGVGRSVIDYDRLAQAVAQALGALAVNVDGQRLGAVTRTATARWNLSNLGTGVGGL